MTFNPEILFMSTWLCSAFPISVQEICVKHFPMNYQSFSYQGVWRTNIIFLANTNTYPVSLLISNYAIQFYLYFLIAIVVENWKGVSASLGMSHVWNK